MISPSDVLNIWDQEEAIGKKSIAGSHDSSGFQSYRLNLVSATVRVKVCRY